MRDRPFEHKVVKVTEVTAESATRYTISTGRPRFDADIVVRRYDVPALANLVDFIEALRGVESATIKHTNDDPVQVNHVVVTVEVTVKNPIILGGVMSRVNALAETR